MCVCFFNFHVTFLLLLLWAPCSYVCLEGVHWVTCREVVLHWTWLKCVQGLSLVQHRGPPSAHQLNPTLGENAIGRAFLGVMWLTQWEMLPWIYTLGMMRVMNLKIVSPMKQYGHPLWPMFPSMTQIPVHDIWMDLLNKGPKNLELTVHKPIEHHSMNSENLPLKWGCLCISPRCLTTHFFWRKKDGIWFLDA